MNVEAEIRRVDFSSYDDIPEDWDVRDHIVSQSTQRLSDGNHINRLTFRHPSGDYCSVVTAVGADLLWCPFEEINAAVRFGGDSAERMNLRKGKHDGA